MADPRCVSISCDVKDIFDKKFKAAVLAKIKQTVTTLINKNNALEVKDNCKEGFFLEATVVSLKADDANKPTNLEAKVTVKVTRLGGAGQVFTAAGSAKAQGINAKKLEDEAKMITGDALEDALTKRAIPQMLKTP